MATGRASSNSVLNIYSHSSPHAPERGQAALVPPRDINQPWLHVGVRPHADRRHRRRGPSAVNQPGADAAGGKHARDRTSHQDDGLDSWTMYAMACFTDPRFSQDAKAA